MYSQKPSYGSPAYWTPAPLLTADRPPSESFGDITNVNIKLDLAGVSASWRLEFEGIFTPQEWNDIVERINRSIKWNPIKYLAALFVCLIAICFIGFGVTPVFYGGFTPLIFVFFFGFGLSAFGLVGSCVYMGLRTQSQFDKVVAELSSEYASKGITFRQERTQVSAPYGRRSTMRTISWLVVSFRNSTRSMGAEPEIQAYPKQVESFESPSTPSAPPAYV
jgi:hypothetical protein